MALDLRWQSLKALFPAWARILCLFPAWVRILCLVGFRPGVCSLSGKAIVRWLVKEAGVDPNTANIRGASVLMIASSLGHEALVKQLVEEHGADLKATDNCGRTALSWAAEDGREKVVKWLVKEGGANPDHATRDGLTALMIAAERRHASVVKWLVEEGGADCALSDTMGSTALIAAVRGGSAVTVSLLLDVLADPCHTDPAGMMAVHHALLAEKEELARLLLGKGEAGAEGGEELLEQARRHVQAFLDRPLTVFVRAPASVLIDTDQRTVTFNRTSTVRFKQSCQVGGRAYYELTILKLGEDPHFGFATSYFKRNCESFLKPGEDTKSWAVDCVGSRTWHASHQGAKYYVKWKAGDVIGLACDLQANQIPASVNCDFSPPNGVLFELAVSLPDALYAAFSTTSGVVGYKFGEEGLTFTLNPKPSEAFGAMAKGGEAGA